MKIFNTIFIVMLLISAGKICAQAGLDKRDFKGSIDSVMKKKMIDKLGIDEQTAEKFIVSYKENNKQIRTIMKEKKDIMESIELDPSASDVGVKLDKIIELEEKIAEQKKNFFNELKTFLTPQQIAKSIIVKKNFEKELRKEINKKKKKDLDRDRPDRNDDRDD